MSPIERIIQRILSEVRTQQKSEFNHGMEHRIYPSKSDPNKLFKVGDEGVTYWVKVFESNPEIFAKVFRRGKLDKWNYYAEIEKLDTSRVLKEWQQIEKKLEELDITGSEDGFYGKDFTDIYLNHGHDQNTIFHIAESLKEYDKNTYILFLKYFKLFKDCERAIENIVGHETFLDAHRYNFGYSADGKLKCLDI